MSVEIPESAEVIRSLTRHYIELFVESAETVIESDHEVLDSPETTKFLDSLEALVCTGPERTFRVCHELAHIIIDPVAEGIDIEENPDAQVAVIYSNEDEPELFEAAAQSFLTFVLHEDCESAAEVFEYLADNADDDLIQIQKFASMLLVLAANAGSGNVNFTDFPEIDEDEG